MCQLHCLHGWGQSIYHRIVQVLCKEEPQLASVGPAALDLSSRLLTGMILLLAALATVELTRSVEIGQDVDDEGVRL